MLIHVKSEREHGWDTFPMENKIASGHFFATLQFLFVSVATQNSNTFHKADKTRSEKRSSRFHHKI